MKLIQCAPHSFHGRPRLASYIEKRGNLWYATLHIPAKHRGQLGRVKFIQSLHTANKREAEDLARPLIAGWKAQIRQAGGQPNAVLQEAQRWREAIRSLPDGGDQREAVEGLLADRAEGLEDAGLPEAEAVMFARVALGVVTPSLPVYEAWSAALDGSGLGKKNIDQQRKDVARMVQQFATVEEISPKAVKGWMRLLADEGATLSSRKRILYSCRSFWNTVCHDEQGGADERAFHVPAGPQGHVQKKAGRPDKRAHFEPLEVVTLWQRAATVGDNKLADLIALAAYTGARIEELCSMKVSDVTTKAFRIEEAKTKAGVREVPIHASIAGLVKRLKTTADDEYLLSGLSFNKYGDRSNAIGKRFGRLKTTAGFPATRVFHSIRKTVATQLENAGVAEGIAADILGHEKKTMSYGLYSGGNSLENKVEALAKVSYPFPDGGGPT